MSQQDNRIITNLSMIIELTHCSESLQSYFTLFEIFAESHYQTQQALKFGLFAQSEPHGK